MSEDMQVYEAQPLDIIRPPAEVLADARKAAVALAEVVKGKKKPVIFNGEQYLEFEDWQTVAKFYGVTAKVIRTQYIEFGEVRGFEAQAVAINRYGLEISGAESMCLSDEPNWKNKPLFQLKSMAQTRACSKVLRNVFAWVVVLAGYRPTPAEELTEDTFRRGSGNGQQQSPAPPQQRSAQPQGAEITVITTIDGVSRKNGKSKDGKDYTRYAIKTPEGEFSTFSETMAAAALTASTAGKRFKITYTESKFGKDALSGKPVEEQSGDEGNAAA